MQGRTAKKRTDTESLVIGAPSTVIFEAFKTPDALMAWLPPDGMNGRALAYDFRAGGRYRIELIYAPHEASGAAKSTDQSDISAGKFLSIEPGEGITQTVEFESSDERFAGEMLMAWSFKPVDTGTLVTVSATNVPNGISASDHHAGLRGSLENLARYVAMRHGSGV